MVLALAQVVTGVEELDQFFILVAIEELMVASVYTLALIVVEDRW